MTISIEEGFMKSVDIDYNSKACAPIQTFKNFIKFTIQYGL